MGDLKELKELELDNVTFLLGKGVYILVYKDEIMYIGSSRHVIRRIRDHIGIIPFDSIYVKVCEPSVAIEVVEAELINKFKPRYNKLMPWSAYHNVNRARPGAKYSTTHLTNYNRTMSKIVREARRAEADSLNGLDSDGDDLAEIARTIGRDSLES